MDADLVPIVMVENKSDLVGEREVPRGAGEMARPWAVSLSRTHTLHSRLLSTRHTMSCV
jgi:hypothetical protein